MKIYSCGRRLAFAAIVAALAAGSSSAQEKRAGSPLRPRTLAEDLQLFSQVLNQIRVNHADSVASHELIMAAIEGMVSAADPHSYVIPAVRLDGERHAAWLAGKLYPVAVDFWWNEGAPIVSAVAPGSKASRLDLLVGDELIEIDGQPVAARSEAELAYTLAGPKGTSVRAKFERRRSDGSIVQLERVLPRERLDEQSAVWSTMLRDQTGYVRLRSFQGARVAEDLNDAVERLERADMQRMILDLRDNGGGRVDQAAEVAGAFLPRGSTVYAIAAPKKALVDTGRVKRAFWKEERRFPLVVMVNSGTASASELVAAALQEHDRALLVGHSTFGKALLMLTLPLSDGSLIALSVGRVSTPCGRVIQRDYKGVSRRQYLRGAGSGADTAGRPSCSTKGGRTVYGGGGILPDVVLPAVTEPLWLARLRETDALLTWSAGYSSSKELGTLDAFAAAAAMPAAALADFRAFAAQRGLSIPQDSVADARLSRALVRAVAYAKWGDDGLQRLASVTDDEIDSAVASFEPLPRLLSTPKR